MSLPTTAADEVSSARESQREMPWSARFLTWRGILGAFGAVLWIALSTWRLGTVPGMSMDEGWYIVSTHGEWPAANPLSGLTAYAGPFPLLLLRLFGTEHGLLVLRGASVLANGAMVVLIARLLAHVFPGRGLAAWALPLIATCPVWLLSLRTGIEVLMLMPVLAVLGLYLCTLRTRWAAFGAGLSWGLLIYNHLIGVSFPVAIAMAWFVTYRRLPPLAAVPFALGLALGILPRGVSLVLYPSELTGSAAQYAPATAFADLRWLPKALWETLSGETLYKQYTGRIAVEIWPYWALSALLLVPWLRRPRAIPRPFWFVLSASVLSAVLVTLIGPYMGVRFFVLPLVGFSTALAMLGIAAVEHAPRFRHAARAVLALLCAGNLFYLGANFYWPWHGRQLGITNFFLGQRSPRTSSWGYLPKDRLVSALLELSPRPEQVVTNATIDRPLKALLHGSGIRSQPWPEADARLRSVFVDYRSGRFGQQRCVNVSNGKMCFSGPVTVDEHFLLYR